MEPFNLTLQQVNLEEKDITEEDTLHSFSNLVSFDSEFVDDKSDVYPVLGKSVVLSQETNDDTQQAIFSTQYHGGEEVFPVKHHLVSSFSSPSTLTRHIGDSVAIEPSEDSFIGFTDAADALALQKSVIGSAPKKPASEDKVALLLADAQEKLLMFNDTLSNSSIPSVQEDENSSFSDSVSSEAVVAEYRRHKHNMYSSKQRERAISKQLTEHSESYIDSGNVTELSRIKSESFSSTSDAENITGHSESMNEAILSKNASRSNVMMDQQSDDLVFVGESGDVDSTQVKQLIPIPGDQLVKQVEKRASGWFTKKERKKSQTMKKSRQSSAGQSPKTSTSEQVQMNHSHTEEKGASTETYTSSLSLESGPNVDMDSDTGSVGGSSVLELQDAMQPIKHTVSADSRSSITEVRTVKESSETEGLRTEHILETQHITHEESLTVTREVNVMTETPDLPPQQKTRQICLTKGAPSGDENLRAELDRLLRENAKLEGKIEVLEAESAAVIKERAQLQSQVATLQQQVKVAHSSVEEIKRERDAVVADIETLKLNRNNLEQVIINAKKLLQDRDEEIRTLNEDLKLSHEANEKLQKKSKEDKMQMVSNQSVIQDLKAKIAELYVDFQMSNQDKILAESEIKSLQTEIKSLAIAKEWYQEQLQLCQDAKAALQKEVSSVKSEVIAQTTMVERLKADNIHIKQLLTEAEQRALSEKEKLAHHLEAIESQMMEREATFAQLQQQKESIEATLQQRLDRGQEEMSKEVAEELTKAQNELRRRQATISVLEHEQADLVKRLTLSQESILERDKTIDSLNRRLVDTDVQLQQVQLQLREKEDEIFRLRDEKSGIEVEVDSLKKEKQAINVALQTLKSDMGKVEMSFKNLKQELKNKQQQIEQLMADNSKLYEELRDSQKKADMARVDSELRHESLQGSAANKLNEDKISDVTELQKQVAVLQSRDADMTHRLEAVRSESSVLIEELRSENRTLEEQVSELRQQLQASKIINLDAVSETPRSEVKNLVSGLQAIQDQLSDWDSKSAAERSPLVNELQNQQVSIVSFISSHELSIHELILLINSIILQNKLVISLLSASQGSSELSVDNHETLESKYRNEIEQLHLKLKASEEQNMELSNHVAELTKNLEFETGQYKLSLNEKEQLYEQLSSSMTVLEKQMDDLKTEKEHLQEELANVQRTSEDFVLLQEENANLRSKLAQIETDTHKQIAKQKAKALKIGKDLEAALKVSHQQKEAHDAAVKEYEEKLAALVAENNKLQTKLEETEKKFSLDQDEKTVQLQHELHEVHQHYEEKTRVEVELREVINRHEVDMRKYVERIEELQQQLADAEATLAYYRNNEEDVRKLMLELEREKGRLAGAMQSHSALKEHTSSLEAALAQHESSSVQVNSELAAMLEKKQKEANYLKEQLDQLQELLNKEKENNETTQQQLITERADHVKVRRELENLFVEHDQLKVTAAGYEQAVKSLNEELEKARESDGKHRSELEHLSQEVRLLREERDRFYAELEARQNKEPIIQEQIKSLEWQVTEKNNEILALKEQLDVISERQHLETSTLATSLQTTKASLREVREELMSLKQEKTMLLTRIAELKAALQASLQHIKLLQETQTDTDKTRVTFDLTSLESLLKEEKSTTISSKPLSFLQATLSQLRGEISSLQSQVDEHSLAVQTTSKAWKEFEEQVRDLREVCKMSAADRAASEKIILEGKRLSENPVLPEIVPPEQTSSSTE